jgi:hypothetical protein
VVDKVMGYCTCDTSSCTADEMVNIGNVLAPAQGVNCCINPPPAGIDAGVSTLCSQAPSSRRLHGHIGCTMHWLPTPSRWIRSSPR